jgi:hypothetical protein
MTSQAELANVFCLSASIRPSDLPEKRPCHHAQQRQTTVNVSADNDRDNHTNTDPDQVAPPAA